MKELRSDCPLEMVLAMAPAWGLQRRIDESAEVAKSDHKLRQKLLDWVESLTENNCGWIEYGVGKEVASRLRAQGVAASTGETGTCPDPLPNKIPREFAADFIFLPETIRRGVWEVVRVGADDRCFMLRMLRWAKLMRHSRLWSVRWTAARIREDIKAWSR